MALCQLPHDRGGVDGISEEAQMIPDLHHAIQIARHLPQVEDSFQQCRLCMPGCSFTPGSILPESLWPIKSSKLRVAEIHVPGFRLRVHLHRPSRQVDRSTSVALSYSSESTLSALQGTEAHRVVLVHKAATTQGAFIAVDEVMPATIDGLQRVSRLRGLQALPSEDSTGEKVCLSCFTMDFFRSC